MKTPFFVKTVKRKWGEVGGEGNSQKQTSQNLGNFEGISETKSLPSPPPATVFQIEADEISVYGSVQKFSISIKTWSKYRYYYSSSQVLILLSVSRL